MPYALPDALSRLSLDHTAFRRALNVLDRQVNAIAQFRAPDFDILNGLLRYLGEYPANYHHPVEDEIYNALKMRSAERAFEVSQIEREHSQVADKHERFAEAVAQVLADAEVSRKAFCQTARDFIAAERRHIRREEGLFFSYALEHLTPEDWENIDSNLRRSLSQPGYGERHKQYAKMLDDIATWELADLKAAG